MFWIILSLWATHAFSAAPAHIRPAAIIIITQTLTFFQSARVAFVVFFQRINGAWVRWNDQWWVFCRKAWSLLMLNLKQKSCVCVFEKHHFFLWKRRDYIHTQMRTCTHIRSRKHRQTCSYKQSGSLHLVGMLWESEPYQEMVWFLKDTRWGVDTKGITGLWQEPAWYYFLYS